MDYDSIKKIIKVFESSSLSLLEAEENGFKIKMQKGGQTDSEPIKAQTVNPSQKENTPIAVNIGMDTQNAVNFDRVTEVHSPMVGVFYSAKAPGEADFVSIGSRVKKGDTLCIIETMKMMNEIISEHDGEVMDICVTNGQVVEYSQVLFKITEVKND